MIFDNDIQPEYTVNEEITGPMEGKNGYNHVKEEMTEEDSQI